MLTAQADHQRGADVRRPIILIGFNRCGTRSFHELFLRNGVRSFHYGRGDLGRTVRDAMARNANAFDELPEFEAFSDFCFRDDDGSLCDLNLEFRHFYRWRPDAYFILNTRDVDGWIRSRREHRNGRVVKGLLEKAGFESCEAIEEDWRAKWLRLHTRARRFFRRRDARFLEFDIETGDLGALRSFLADVTRSRATPFLMFDRRERAPAEMP